MNGFSIIMPTFNQRAFIRRAIMSLQKQTYKEWELIIINDGSTDHTYEYISDFIKENDKIKYIENSSNQGLGFAINRGLDIAVYDYIAYLPSDDFYYHNHLETLINGFDKSKEIVLVFSGIKYDSKDSLLNSNSQETNSIRKDYCAQLVQMAHKRTMDRWVERNEWVSENLFYTFWRKLTDKGTFFSTKQITCNWTNHPLQRHKIMSENYGGNINYYRIYYNVKEPIKMKVSNHKFVDEEKMFGQFRKKIAQTKDSLKILLVGELAYNPERIYALEEYGHKLYGLWTPKPTYSHSTVGCLPFGNVEDIPYEKRHERIKEIKPDIIYGLLNFGAIDLAHEIQKNHPNIPFVWHFKEGPHYSIQIGQWEKLIDLYTFADGRIYLSEESQKWYEQFIPKSKLSLGISYLLDGDLPKRDYFTNKFSPKLSEIDGEIHTVVPGRMIGMDINNLISLSENNIHIHLYTESYHTQKEEFSQILKKVIPRHFHIHSHCSPTEWVQELSKYDAGWIHCFESKNYGDLQKLSWDDLNLPARISTLAAAGLPIIQRDNSGHIVAMQSCVEKLNFGVSFNTINDLCAKLQNKNLMLNLTKNILNNREKFSFDYHVPDLINFFRNVINNKNIENI